MCPYPSPRHNYQEPSSNLQEIPERVFNDLFHTPGLALNESLFKVLIVEDDESQWPLWEHVFMIMPASFKIDWQKSEEGARDLISQAYRTNSPYDLVISDVYLQNNGNGIMLWNLFGEVVGYFIFVSEIIQTQSELNNQVRFGNPDFIPKPISTKKCRESIEKGLRQTRKTFI